MLRAAVRAAVLLAVAGGANAQRGPGNPPLPRTTQQIECVAAAADAAIADAPVADAPSASPEGAAAPACRVDVSTYVGWRVFHEHCAVCHAADATGSSFAPDLTWRMDGMSQRAFIVGLAEGYLGPASTMPPRGANPDVARYYEELWAYLSARARDALPPGPLEPLRSLAPAAP